MDKYVKTVGGVGGAVAAFPYYSANFKQDYPQVSRPQNVTDEWLANYDVYPVADVSEPVYDPQTHKLERNETPTFNGNEWELGWSVTPLTPEEAFTKAYASAGSAFSGNEKLVLLGAYLEVKIVRLAILAGQSAGSVNTPMLDAINAVFPGQTKLQVANTIETRAETFLTAAATALATKIKDGG